jgi:RHS repeat-associated protein
LSRTKIPYNLRFPGQIYDSQAGLQQNYFRDYDPAVGRYVESDPIGLDGGINIYAYVTDNPVNRLDLLGLISCPACKHPETDWNCVEALEAIAFLPSEIILTGTVVGIITFIRAPNPVSAGVALTAGGLTFMIQTDIFQYCQKCIPNN